MDPRRGNRTPYDEETLERALAKVKKMASSESDFEPCRRDEDVFEHLLKSHASVSSMLEIPKTFRDFHLDAENLAFFDMWEYMIRQQIHKFASDIWNSSDRSPEKLEQMVKGQIAVGKWQIFMLGNFLQGRGRRFKLGRNLAPVLMHTDVKVPAIDLFPPCAFMSVKLPPGILNMVEEGKDPIDCSYLIISRQQLFTADMQDEPFPLDEEHDFLAVMAVSAPRGDDTFGDLTLIDTMALREGKSVDEEIQAYVERRKVYSIGTHLQMDLPEGKVRYGNPVANIFALAANIILYSTNRTADIVPHNQATLEKLQRQVARHSRGKKRAKANQKLHEARRSSIYVIGGNFKPKDGRILSYQKSDRAVSVRHMVRGHWKMQAYGPDRQDRKHIFVEPYWRGPELAEMVERDYVLE
jgi:hypothetical protein